MSNINQVMVGHGQVRSAIRDLFEYGLQRSKEIGRENVFDYSLGNPSVPAPDQLNDTIRDLVNNMDSVALHGYTSAPGADDVREKIAETFNKRTGENVPKDLIYMTCGAAASLTITLRALVNPGDEVIGIAPYFPEYKVFAESAGADFVAVEADLEKFQINFESLEKAFSPKTKAIIINSPNNPTGAVLNKETFDKLVSVLEEKQKEYGHAIYLLSDEPYRELVYDDVEVPYPTKLYDNTIILYSFSKSLSIPGERIGYILVSPKVEDAEEVFAGIAGAGRALGYVCAPSLMQRVAKECADLTSDISVYKKNRDLLYNALKEYGYECVHPDGAFYLFVKALEPDAVKFSEKAKEHELLIVPSDSFGCEGYIRLSYCVSTEMIERSLPAFKALAEAYK